MQWVQIDILEKIHSNTNKYFLLYRFIKIRLASELIWNIVFFFFIFGKYWTEKSKNFKKKYWEIVTSYQHDNLVSESRIFLLFFFGHEIPWETISGHGRQKLNLTANILKISVQNIQEISNILFQKWNRW